MAGNWSNIEKEIRRASAVQRIGRHVAWENLACPRPVDLSRVPWSVDALTPEYLTHVLCGNHPGAKVEAITPGKRRYGSTDGSTFTVAYNRAGVDAGLPTDFFHKFAGNFYSRLHLLRIGIDRNEINFYNRIAPELDIEIPRAFHAAFEDNSCRSSIILEDVVASRGAVFFEAGTPFHRTDIEGMLLLLADIHAQYWASDRLDNEFTWLMDPVHYTHILMEGLELKDRSMIQGVERARAVLPPSLIGREQDIWAAFMKSMEITGQGPITFLHYDPHLRNYYRTAEGRIGLADWQATMKGAWSHDVAYAVLTSLKIEDRRKWEKDLLALYLERLKEKGVTPPGFNDAWEQYRRQTLYTLIAWLVTIGAGELQPNMQPDSESLQMIARAATAIEDLGSVQLLCGDG